MSSRTNCPKCGSTYPADIAGGMCPQCLLSGLLGVQSGPRLGERAGDTVGPYELIEVLGEGGMGSVWRACQHHPVEREVALKIIRLGMDTREVVSRFEGERQSLAMMDHPGIARVYEAGATETGRPYFVMELVDGEPVTDYCVSRSLKVEDRLRLFRDICAAVAHAHRKGVIHRDLKPSNVMVVERAAGPQVKVIDFGIAKLLETENDGRTYATRFGHAVGTPGYMSPEQAGAEPDVDTRSDVYSLGALLYEMLTGSPPLGRETFREAAHAEVMRIIREIDPPRPSTRMLLASRTGPPSPLRIARDLDRIVMKALARERERRYGGAASLGEDVRRFLDHEPVSATDPTLGYRAGKFIRKHRLSVAFATALALGLVLSVVFVSREAKRAEAFALSEREARLVALSSLADSYRNAGLAAAEQRQDALAALWFTEAAEVAAHDPERARANRLRAGLHAARAPLLVRMIPVKESLGRLAFDQTSNFLHLGWSGTRHFILDVERGSAIDFSRDINAACWSGPAEAAISSPGGFELRDLRQGTVLRSVAVEGPVSDLWASGDGSLLLVVSNHCRVWSHKSESWQSGPVGHPGRPRYAAFSPDGKWLLTIDEHACLRVFPTDGDAPGSNFEAMQLYRGTAAFDPFLPRFTADSAKVLAKIPGNLLKIDPATGDVVEKCGTGGSASDITSSGDLIATPNGLLEPSNASPLFSRFLGHSFFTRDESAIYSTNSGDFLDLSGRRISVFPLPSNRLTESPDGHLTAFIRRDSVNVYRIARSEPFIEVPGPADGRLALNDAETIFANAGIATIHESQCLTRAYRIEDGQPAGPQTNLGHQLLCATFLSNGRFVAGCRRDATHGRGSPEDVGGPGLLRSWDLASGQPVGEPLALPAEPWALERSPDDTWLAVLTRDGAILRVDPGLRTAEELLRLPSKIRGVGSTVSQGSLKFSKDGSRLYANGLGPNTWAIDLRTRRILFDTGHPDSDCYPIQLDHGLLLAPTAHNGHQWLFDAEDGNIVPLPADVRPFCPVGSQLNPDGRRLLLSGRSWVNVVDWKTGQRLGKRYYPGRALAVYSDFVPQSPWIFTAANTPREPSSLALWDPRSGLRLNPDWPIQDAEVTDLRTTRDGHRTVICQRGLGCRIILWDEIRRYEEWGDALSPADRHLLAELEAGRLLVDGSIVEFPLDLDWHKHWKVFDARHPNFFAIRPPREDLIRWHRNREVRFRESRPATAAWHRARLEELGAAEK